MDRRRNLIGQVKENSGKLVNVITLKPYIKKIGLFVDYHARYPVKSLVVITVSTNGAMGQGQIGIEEMNQEGSTGTEIDIMPESNEITVISIDPQEDDTYIYEVVVEY